MARVRLTEFAGKKLFLGDEYTGITCTMADYEDKLSALSGDSFVVKVDVGIKKRNQQGLVQVGLSKSEVKTVALKYFKNGYQRVLVETLVPHESSEEKYLSVELVREGWAVISSTEGGVSVEESSPATVTELDYDSVYVSIKGTSTQTNQLIGNVIEVMKRYQLVFVEINPYVEQGGETKLLDAAVLIDSESVPRLPEWVSEHVVDGRVRSHYEEEIDKISYQSPATFSLKVLSEDASVYTLLSGGGASLVTLDTLVHQDLQTEIGNYGEYSGAPSREETKLYTEVILKLLLNSKAKKKVLLVVGGVANFTDITTTFSGIVDALSLYVDELKAQQVSVIVRRGGPRQKEGLQKIEDFLESANIPHSVNSPAATIAEVSKKVRSYLS
jgi:succinyl-CoA synthetase beta subunit